MHILFIFLGLLAVFFLLRSLINILLLSRGMKRRDPYNDTYNRRADVSPLGKGRRE